MAGLARWAGFALGLVIVVVTFSSVVGTIVLPKGVRSRISYTVWRAIERPFMAAAARMRRYESKTACSACSVRCRCSPCSAPGFCCFSSATR